jgi:hypothetical protein
MDAQVVEQKTLSTQGLQVVEPEGLQELATQINSVKVIDPQTADMAGQLILAGKAMIKRIESLFVPIKRSIDDSKRTALRLEREELAKIEPAVELLSRQLVSWRTEQEAIRRAAEEAARRAADERRRIEAEALRRAEVARQEEERKRIQLEQEAARLKREEILKADDAAAQKRIAEDRERLRLQAEENRKATEAAEEIAINEAAKKEAELVPAPVVPTAIKQKGLAMRDCWSFEIFDEAAVPREYCIPDLARLNKLATVEKERLRFSWGRAVNNPVMAKTR